MFRSPEHIKKPTRLRCMRDVPTTCRHVNTRLVNPTRARSLTPASTSSGRSLDSGERQYTTQANSEKPTSPVGSRSCNEKEKTVDPMMTSACAEVKTSSVTLRMHWRRDALRPEPPIHLPILLLGDPEYLSRKAIVIEVECELQSQLTIVVVAIQLLQCDATFRIRSDPWSGSRAMFRRCTI